MPTVSVPDPDDRVAGPGSPSLGAYRALASALRRGVFLPGERLPGERVLSKRLGVGRATLRQALLALAHEGLVESRRGSGWWVTEAILGEPPNELLSFTEFASLRRLAPSARVLERSVRPATIEEADKLEIAPGKPLFHLRRLRMLDGSPISVSTSIVPLEKAPSLPEHDFTTASLYHVLESVHGLSARRCDYVVQAQPADPDSAELLGVAPGTPALAGSWITFDQSGSPLEIGSIVYRGDRYRFQATLVRSAGRRYRPGGPLPGGAPGSRYAGVDDAPEKLTPDLG